MNFRIVLKTAEAWDCSLIMNNNYYYYACLHLIIIEIIIMQFIGRG